MEVKFAYLNSPIFDVTEDVCLHFWYSIAVSFVSLELDTFHSFELLLVQPDENTIYMSVSSNIESGYSEKVCD